MFVDWILILFLVDHAGSLTVEGDPIVLIPGFGGSKIQGLVENYEKPHWYCYTSYADWNLFWVTSELFVPEFNDCVLPFLPLRYHKDTKEFTNLENVRTRTIFSLEGVDYMDNGPVKYLLGYYHKIIERIEATGRYKPNENLLAAPFDFRYGAYSFSTNSNMKYYERLRNLIEGAHEDYGAKVTIVAHSMGNAVLLNFLKAQGEEWTVTHVKRVIMLAPAVSGAFESFRSLIDGDNWGDPMVDPSVMLPILRNVESTYYLSPVSEADGGFWPRDKPCVSTSSKTYECTLDGYVEYFKDLGLPSNMTDMMEAVYGAMIESLDEPPVPIDIVYGTGVDTQEGIVYDTPEPHYGKEKYVMGDGDGTVSVKTVEAMCNNWSNVKRCKDMEGVSHVGLVIEDSVVSYLVDLLREG